AARVARLVRRPSSAAAAMLSALLEELWFRRCRLRWFAARMPAQRRLGKTSGLLQQERFGADAVRDGLGPVARGFVVELVRRTRHRQRTRAVAAVAEQFAALRLAGGRRLLPGLRLVSRYPGRPRRVPGARLEPSVPVHRAFSALETLPPRAGLLLACERATTTDPALDPGARPEVQGRVAVDQRVVVGTTQPAAGGGDLPL